MFYVLICELSNVKMVTFDAFTYEIDVSYLSEVSMAVFIKEKDTFLNSLKSAKLHEH